MIIYLVNIWNFLGSPVTSQIPILPFFKVRMGSSCGCCLSSGLFLFSLRVSFSPVFHKLCSLCFQDMYISFTLFLDGNPLSLPFISFAFQYGRYILFLLFFLPLWWAVIYHRVLTDELQPLQRSDLGVRFVSVSVCREMRSLCLCCFLNCRVKQCRKRSEVSQVNNLLTWHKVPTE